MSTPLLWNDYAAGSGMATPFVRNLQYSCMEKVKIVIWGRKCIIYNVEC